MRSKVWGTVIAIAAAVIGCVFLVTLALGAAPDWQARSTQAVGKTFVFRDSSRWCIPDTASVRGYIHGADSSATENQINFTGVASCSCFTSPVTLRDSWWDIYRISPAPKLSLGTVYIEGQRAAKEAVDDTAGVAGSFTKRVVQDYSIATQKVARDSVYADTLFAKRIQTPAGTSQLAILNEYGGGGTVALDTLLVGVSHSLREGFASIANYQGSSTATQLYYPGGSFVEALHAYADSLVLYDPGGARAVLITADSVLVLVPVRFTAGHQ